MKIKSNFFDKSVFHVSSSQRRIHRISCKNKFTQKRKRFGFSFNCPLHQLKKNKMLYDFVPTRKASFSCPTVTSVLYTRATELLYIWPVVYNCTLMEWSVATKFKLVNICLWLPILQTWINSVQCEMWDGKLWMSRFSQNNRSINKSNFTLRLFGNYLVGIWQ